MEKWEQRNRPIRLEKRFEFDNYQKTRDFLDLLGELSEARSLYPDISFGKTYVNITLRPESEENDGEHGSTVRAIRSTATGARISAENISGRVRAMRSNGRDVRCR